MEQHRKDIKKQKASSAFQMLDKLHPHKVYLYVGMMSSVFILLSMLVAYLITKPDGIIVYQYYLPKSFILSSFILGLSAYFMSKVLRLFRKDDIKGVSKSLGLTLLLTVAFSGLQLIGYQKLKAMGVFSSGDVSISYLYVISVLHVIMFVGGVISLAVFYLKTLKNGKDVVKSLIMVTTPYEKIKLEMLVTYWFFISLAWLALFMFFLTLY